MYFIKNLNFGLKFNTWKYFVSIKNIFTVLDLKYTITQV